MRTFSGPDQSTVLSNKLDQQTEEVIDQLDCIEDDVLGVQSEIQQLRVTLTRLASLRAKFDAIAR